MNTKLLASIAVFVLLTAVVSVPLVQSAYAADAKADKKAADAKAKADKKAADTKAKADKKAATSTAKSGGTPSGATAKEVTVDMVKGSGSPGCADTNSCYSPFEAKIAVGGTVTWNNVDSAAHYATSGQVPTADGKFDSGMVMAGNKFSYKFDTAGTYDYFCMVHPWMIGKVTVQ